MLHLGVNIDHIATLRQARYATMLSSPNAEPVLLEAARETEAAGADSITIHLRADRRHIQDADVYLMKRELKIKLNLEMGNTPEIVDIALAVKPDFVCLVPENRQEITTEGGLAVTAHAAALKQTTTRLRENGTQVSFFVDPVLDHIRAAADCGADMVELHTGTFANHFGAERDGLTTKNLRDLFSVPHLAELNIGHSIVSRAIIVGLQASIREIRSVMAEYES